MGEPLMKPRIKMKSQTSRRRVARQTLTAQKPIRLPVMRPPSIPAIPETLPGRLGQGAKGVFNKVVDGAKSLVEDVSSYFGFTIECMNGGKRISNNQCNCPLRYKGDRCEHIQCDNNGVPTRVDKQKPPITICACPDKLYITGEFCEKVSCANSGVWSASQNSCVCTDSWYYGRFCELPYFVAFPLGALIFIILFVYLCNRDWCPRNAARQNRRNQQREARTRVIANQRTSQSSSRSRRAGHSDRNGFNQEHLLGEERGAPMRSRGAYPSGVVPPFVIRLDTIPTFNPQMLGGVDPAQSGLSSNDFKDFEPPPSYYQAMAAPRPPSYSDISQNGSSHPPQPPS